MALDNALIAFKKLFNKAHTSPDKPLLPNETIAVGFTTSATSIFADAIPSNPGTSVDYDQDTDGLVEKVTLVAEFVAGTDTVAGRHGFQLKLPSDYEANSSNPNAGTGFWVDDQVLWETTGSVQIVPPSFGEDYRAVLQDTTTAQIPELDAREWIPYEFGGIVYQETPPGTGADAGNPGFYECHLYIGPMSNTKLDTSLSASLIFNDSLVAGDKVDDALNELSASLSASFIDNDSFVPGDTVSDALTIVSGQMTNEFWTVNNTFANKSTDLTASVIVNDSLVVGAYVDDALNELSASLSASLIDNDSSLPGATVSDAITILSGQMTDELWTVNNTFADKSTDLTASIIVNDSSMFGVHVDDALDHVNNTFVTGSGLASDNAMVRFSGTDGRAIQSTNIEIDDGDNAFGFNNLLVSGSLIVAFASGLGITGSHQTLDSGDPAFVGDATTIEINMNPNGAVEITGSVGAAPVDSVFTRTGAVVAAASDYDASQVDNDSNVAGTFVDDALNHLDGAKAEAATALTASVLSNDSNVEGSFIDDALNHLDGAKAEAATALTASVLNNDSTVPGTFIDDALNALTSSFTNEVAFLKATKADSATALTASVLSNDSNVPGAFIDDALNHLDGAKAEAATALTASVLSNDSTVAGDFIDDALNTLSDSITALEGGVTYFDLTGSLTASNIQNDSNVAGTNVDDALNTLEPLFGTKADSATALTASVLENDSTVPGTFIDDALNALTSSFTNEVDFLKSTKANSATALTASVLVNDSNVAGTFIDDALNHLDGAKAEAATALTASVLNNDSNVAGTFIDDALNHLDGAKAEAATALTASVLSNDSNVAGAFIDDALNALDSTLDSVSNTYVTGSGTVTDNQLVRFNGTNGRTIQNSAIIVGDNDGLFEVQGLSMSGTLEINGFGGGGLSGSHQNLSNGDPAFLGGTGITINMNPAGAVEITGSAGVTSVFSRSGIVVAAASDYNASQVDNDSNVAGTFVDDALNHLDGAKAESATALTASVLHNDSSVNGGGGNIAGALDHLDGAKAESATALTASVLSNDSNVPGSFIDDALNHLDGAKAEAATALTASVLVNDSTVPGVYIDDALDHLIGLGGSDTISSFVFDPDSLYPTGSNIYRTWPELMTNLDTLPGIKDVYTSIGSNNATDFDIPPGTYDLGATRWFGSGIDNSSALQFNNGIFLSGTMNGGFPIELSSIEMQYNASASQAPVVKLDNSMRDLSCHMVNAQLGTAASVAEVPFFSIGDADCRAKLLLDGDSGIYSEKALSAMAYMSAGVFNVSVRAAGVGEATSGDETAIDWLLVSGSGGTLNMFPAAGVTLSLSMSNFSGSTNVIGLRENYHEAITHPDTVGSLAVFYGFDHSGTTEAYWKDDASNQIRLTQNGHLSNQLKMTAVKTTNYTAGFNEMALMDLVTGGNLTGSLPTITAAAHDHRVGFKISSLTSGSTLLISGAEQIDGMANIVLNSGHESVILQADNDESMWWRIG